MSDASDNHFDWESELEEVESAKFTGVQKKKFKAIALGHLSSGIGRYKMRLVGQVNGPFAAVCDFFAPDEGFFYCQLFATYEAAVHAVDAAECSFCGRGEISDDDGMFASGHHVTDVREFLEE